MPETPDPDRLRALEAKLAAARSARAKPAEAGKGFSQGEVAWRMVTELVAGMVIGLGIGFGLDHVFGTRPIFLIIFVLLGFVAGIRTVIGTAKDMQAKAESQRQGQDDLPEPKDDGRG